MAKSTKTPRGLRNNNPLNIRRSHHKWLGKITDPSSCQTVCPSGRLDPDFEQFTDLKFGVRAALVLLKTYTSRHHLNTVQAIISRWAPASENNTEAYVAFVCRWGQLTRHQKITFAQRSAICRLVLAMAAYECGTYPFSLDYACRVYDTYFTPPKLPLP